MQEEVSRHSSPRSLGGGPRQWGAEGDEAVSSSRPLDFGKTCAFAESSAYTDAWFLLEEGAYEGSVSQLIGVESILGVFLHSHRAEVGFNFNSFI